MPTHRSLAALVAEKGTGRLSAVAFGGGVTAAVLMTVSHSVLAAAAERAGEGGGIPAETAIGLMDISRWVFGSGAAMGFAVLIAATAVASFRTGFLPGWLVWVSAVLIAGLLSPYSYLFAGLAPMLWVLIVSILLYQRGRAEATTEAA